VEESNQPWSAVVVTIKKGATSESNPCGGASGIATVSQDTGDGWTVTAGATTGSSADLNTNSI
jgi:hypothetical protein